MDLYLNGTSPYARVARIAALEKGLEDRLTLRWSDPWADDEPLIKANPVGRIPVLVTDEGEAIGESLLIAQYLDAQSESCPLLPRDGLARILHLSGLGQGLMDAAFNTVIMRKHHGKEIDQSLLGQRRLRAIERTLASLDQAFSDQNASRLTLGDIVVGVALAYLAFRLPEIAWQVRHPSLATRYAQLMKRESFTATEFG